MSIRVRIEKDKAIARYKTKEEREYYKSILIDAKKTQKRAKELGTIDKEIEIIIREGR